ncbi:outer membrane protein [Sporocytophaga myxococcoides]|uniref:Outer membrane protein n=1 Tax=Sporocytophaga myxococcoides TaxID=153721 RepID=A0A098LKX2_9BACT|nr:DUF4142 domain-containing protein [Sporocytophaga myxococcoides]GAL87646.1 outer membrane protein [Sporocytophaga myxococcoides]
MKKNKLHLKNYPILGFNSLRKISVFLILVVISLFGCKDDDDDNAPPPQQVQTLSVTDTAFMRKATLFNLAEINLGRMALASASTDSIRIFGASMVNERTLAQTELNTIALQNNVLLPQVPDSLHRAMEQQLQFMTGSGFDDLLISTIITDHQNAREFFTTEINSGDSQEIKNYASKYLPLIDEELVTALRLQGQIVR